MNKNIEVINEHLWAVNRAYVKAGYIKELTPIMGSDGINEYASLTDDGIMILNKQSELYPTLKLFIPKIMAYTDEVLLHCMESVKVNVSDNYEKLYLNVMEWEVKRRCVMAEYLKSHSKLTFKKRIIKSIRKWVT
ncbi:hypothetical protein [Anaerosporobacter sp.]|uniref:hypothetical protein n=1 Tax=Anaerosporobacter sp. TaxID=1872529 RepID=UPI00286F0E14|nr:hypothetical protein [Anaerosporobacter sp.]